MKVIKGVLTVVGAPVFIALGLHCGIRVPDIDQQTKLLIHRSLITHSPLIPLMLFIPASSTRFQLFRWFAMGISLAFAVHHAFDLFPRGWTGGALISIPFYGHTPALFSWIWIAFSVFACAYLAARLVRGRVDAVCYLLGLGYIFILTAPKEHTWFGPAVSLIIAVIVLGRVVLARRESDEI